MRVNTARLLDDLESLAQIGRGEDGAINRAAFSAADAAARQWYQDRCTAAGLELRCDALGNMTAGVTGSFDPPVVWSGSHMDTVPDGGPLDGALGTVAALECVRRIAEERPDLACPVQAVVFSDEEGNYGHLFGSYGLVHGYGPEQLDQLTGRSGDRVADALNNFAWRTTGPVESARLVAGRVRSFVELHIEQGPTLEARRVPIGVVQSIVGLGGATVTFTGRADHAGTTPMTMRRDPTRATGEFLTRLAGIAASVSEVAVITCGRLSFSPGGSNVVPHQAELTLDFRAPVAGDVDALSQAVIRVAGECAAMHGVESDVRLDQPVRPVEMNAGIRDHIQAAADECGLPTMALPSGAGHDSQNLARLAPTGMIFVPSHNGRSHSRFEYTDPDLLEQGANVLMATLLRLAG